MHFTISHALAMLAMLVDTVAQQSQQADSLEAQVVEKDAEIERLRGEVTRLEGEVEALAAAPQVDKSLAGPQP